MRLTHTNLDGKPVVVGGPPESRGVNCTLINIGQIGYLATPSLPQVTPDDGVSMRVGHHRQLEDGTRVTLRWDQVE